MRRKSAARNSVQPGDEIDRHYLDLLSSFYEKQDHRRASRFAERLETALKLAPEESIRAEECRSLIAEVRGDLSSAIKHREREIQLIRKLHKLSAGKPGESYVLRQYSVQDLSDRLDLLAILYRAAGQLARAIGVLEESRRLCQTHRVRFDAAALLRDYGRQQRRKNGKGGLPSRQRQAAALIRAL
jgi:tetratricopeptide (TPR) repeat protein